MMFPQSVICFIVGHNIWPQDGHQHYPEGKPENQIWKVCLRCLNCIKQ